VNSIEILKRFYNWQNINKPLKTSTQTLFVYLILLCDKLKKFESIGITSKEVERNLGITFNTFKSAMLELCENGLLIINHKPVNHYECYKVTPSKIDELNIITTSKIDELNIITPSNFDELINFSPSKIETFNILTNKTNNNNSAYENFKASEIKKYIVDAVVDAPLKSYRKGLETNEQHKNDIRENKHEERIQNFLLNYHINAGYNLRNEIEVFVIDQEMKEPGQRRTITEFIKHLINWLLKGYKIRHNTEQERKEVQTKMRAKGDGFTK